MPRGVIRRRKCGRVHIASPVTFAARQTRRIDAVTRCAGPCGQRKLGRDGLAVRGENITEP
jgi:hypothetical protein